MSLVFLSILPIFLCSHLTSGDLGPPITIARCRVNCLQVTLKRNARIDDAVCQRKNSCRMCWDLCPYLFRSYDVWGPLCDNQVRCYKGCKTACAFKHKVPTVPKNQTITWDFPEKPFLEVYRDTQRCQVFWSRPVPSVPITGKAPFVYILMARDSTIKDGHWRQVSQTASETVALAQTELPFSPEFWLMAVNKNGTKVDNFVDAGYSPIEGSMTVKDVDEVRGIASTGKLNLTVKMLESHIDGKVEALIEWNHPTHIQSHGEQQITYAVHIFLQECGIFEDSPHCNIPPQYFEYEVEFRFSDKPSSSIEVMYNAQYMVMVEYQDQSGVFSQDKDFLTPFCPDVDEETFKYCPPDTSASTNIPNADDPDCPPDTSASTNIPNADDSDEETENLLWNIRLVQMMYNEITKNVEATFNWTVPFNNSNILYYEVFWKVQETPEQTYTEGGRRNFTTTIFNTALINLELKPHLNYVMVGKVKYYDVDRFIQTYTSEYLYFDTNNTDAMYKEPQRVTDSRDLSWKNLNDIVVAATCIATVVMVSLIVLFIYMKRQSFKDIIISKTAVAKSNSYKSNVGCKVDYSNQLLVMSDEWELDPRFLKFASPIGQGAFGKVVTGYYKESRVAIKLVRDSAPLSYKEDLLAEINLMKRIGSHPNIVSMIGACTLTEPIALVMEYVPYGNLQNFLKKCRLEGDLQKRAGRPSEVVYSIMGVNGGIESGVITPADMLSFARQVAMAMEYLSEKKYVHRDLAARNILLDYNKVVKVCDFGLSRDIYNDNQYHKVTSGKLPLKWMAIESLRDRIFTTQSDVWSFGILLWEIVTMGGSPYTNIALADLYYVLANGYRMEKPSNCSKELYAIIRRCWMESPSERLTFSGLRVEIEQLLSRDRDYLELENIDVPLSTSETSSIPKSENDTISLLTGRSTQPQKSVTISLPPPESPTGVVLVEKSTEWLIRGRDEETMS
ncbi:uncharacterized protein LOC132565175 [Ylistrum balloti]|uniref:uncharacterized protein LOC132565175 n=1 Tax=Ylistrum balloti TaxID=509963 RepID=UPI002905C913|nr:uncharacterized protein LOC132565175 [Ylistrum balloti]